MVVHHDSFGCVDGGMVLGRGVEVAPVEVDAVGVHSVMPPTHSIWVKDWKYIEDKPIPEKCCFGVVFCKLFDDAGHDMGGWDFPWVHSGSDHHAFLVADELLGLILVGE